MSTTTKPVIRTPEGSDPGHAMEPTPTYLSAMAALLTIIDGAYNQYWLRGKTPGLFDAKALFSSLMAAYGEVVQAGAHISKRARGGGGVTPDHAPDTPELDPGLKSED